MKRIIAFSVCVLLGVGIGWYFGFTRPATRNQRKLLSEYQFVRDNFHTTDKEMAAAMALGALVKLEQGGVEKAKSRLETTISIYYRGHRLGDD